ncbi:glutamate-5-semialdehyde dehydrogenase [Selenomonas noxia ATCC 43541]|uniref:Gamma-glutamyl phosphate reductase n=1 Tax=Selenomonas noxia F0398 TaxID=702437 RepID=A0ABP2MRJ2_9FIRM|nr:glutamate-5-semialdehyde dehydrogenase [Selenomonas noxia]EFF65586.1 glutamate-5-semialdehyde dehydrogenase [Selenomonas noxia ATCC 43541]EHG25270.1 glutamate-5-semialdehyde dehydrogenase [Selenomonas noxia F0398]
MIEQEIRTQAEAAKAASYALAALRTDVRNAALEAMADALMEHTDAILHENAADVSEAKEAGMRASYIDRLHLDAERVASMAEGLRLTAALPDPLGREDYSVRRPNGLEIRRMRVPLGVIGMIYEARPNVTADAIGLCLKSGNAVVLRGGSDALRSNRAIAEVLSRAAYTAGIPSGAVQLLAMKDRSAVDVMTHLTGLLDVLIPRGGAGLIRRIVENSSVPVIETGAGVCHVYVDRSADVPMALQIVRNAKVSRPSVCNAAETLLVHESIAEEFLPRMADLLRADGVELRGCERTRAILTDIAAASEEDWAAEYGDLILAIRTVKDIDAALAHINRYNTGHSEAIVTNDIRAAHDFQQRVDASTVYVNASTRFTDGFEFGFGAEIGISTQKLHVRGPMGLDALTSTKYLVYGEGQVREAVPAAQKIHECGV